MKQDEARGPFRPSRLARLAGVSTDTLRHYERRGVLARAPRSANGYRLYPPEALARVRLVRRALAVGFTLEELSRVLRVRDRGGAPCRAVREMARRRLRLLEERMRELEAVRRELAATVRQWDRLLTRTAPGARAGLLDALAGRPPLAGGTLPPLHGGTRRERQIKKRK